MSLSRVELVNLLTEQKYLPILAKDQELAIRQAEHLQKHGQHAMEVVCRWDGAIPTIRAIKNAHPDLLVCAGTLTTDKIYQAARNAGADFGVSPDCTMILQSIVDDWPFFPGVMTANEITEALSILEKTGLSHKEIIIKFFPAIPNLAVLKAISSLYTSRCAFQVSGGVDMANAAECLCIPGVKIVNGSAIWPPNVPPLPEE